LPPRSQPYEVKSLLAKRAGNSDHRPGKAIREDARTACFWSRIKADE
jgi:hypothetical protein